MPGLNTPPPAEPTSVRERALAAFRGISAKAAASNLERLARLDEAVSAASEGRLDPSGYDSAAGVAHTLAGSAGTFGYPDATGPARELEDLFSSGVLSAGQLPRAHELVQGIRVVLSAAPDEDDI